MSSESAEHRTRKVIDRCVSCGHCRDLMNDTSCLYFPRLYQLRDRETAGGARISAAEMKQMLDLCNTCGICPCPTVQTWIRQAKDAFVERAGLPYSVRLIENVQFVGKLGGAAPRLANLLVGDSPVAVGLKRLAGLHPARRLPRFPLESFDSWAQSRGLTHMPQTAGRKVAYFAGCTARYLFPEVAKATVEVLQHNGIAVFVPEQKCCGMPTMLEGDRPFTFDRARFNLAELGKCVAAGFDIVCSCPTCGYLLKSVLREGAEYSEAYRSLVQRMSAAANGDADQVSARLALDDAALTGRSNARSAHGRQPWMLGLVPWKVFRDHGYFAEIDGLERLRVANHTYDLGEYLRELQREGQLNCEFGAVAARNVAYFAPCHQRQQDIGQPWMELLGLLPGVEPTQVGDGFDCCGQGGIMGFKKDFHETSLTIGARLTRKIAAAVPERLATDCLSCRLQFQQMLPYEVLHPVEILRDAYRAKHRGQAVFNGILRTFDRHDSCFALTADSRRE
ncbi:MAG: FeS-binding protein [Rhodocyclales bacterium]|nr:FeS-binding protein [Rhodocyclales bacterium]